MSLYIIVLVVLALFLTFVFAGKSSSGTEIDIESVEVSDGVRSIAESGRKIEAIKLLRQETGLGLREAKDVVDSL